jgi:hypothetical protein
MSDTEIQTEQSPAPAAPAAEAPAAPAEKAPETFSETLHRVAQQATARMVRGADGRFQAREGAAPATPAVELPGSPTAATPEPAPPAIEAPQSLPDVVKALWPSLPRAAQENWSKRESEAHRKITTDGERLKSLDAVEAAIADSAQFLSEHRIPKPEYIRRLAVADQMLRANGPQALAQIAQMYGIDVRAAFATPGYQPDPNNALSREITQLRSEIASLKSDSDESRINAGLQMIDNFRKDKAHFDEAVPMMEKMIASGVAKDLAEAYDMAINADPGIRAKRETEAKKAADEKAAKDAKEKAEKDARIAPLGRRPGSVPTAPIKGKTMFDTLRATAKSIEARS